MGLNNYYETISFEDGVIINTSRRIRPNYTGVNHWHPFAEILLSLREGNEVTLNFRKYQPKPNDIIISYPGDLHNIRNVSEDSFLVIQFSVSLITVIRDFHRLLPVLYKASYCPYEISNSQSEEMVWILKEIVRKMEEDVQFKEATVYALLLKFFSLLGERCINEHLYEVADVTEEQPKNAKLIAEACLFITQNCAEPLTLEDVTRQIGVSRSYFSHLFKDYTQTTFVDYLMRERVRRAESLFLGPKKKFIDIAFECGFNSVSSFNRTFKKIKGISPSEFRKAVKEEL